MENEKKLKICDVDVVEGFRQWLAFLIKPRTVYELMNLSGKSYSHVHQTLNLWEVRGWVIQLRKHKGQKQKYLLNTQNIEP